MIDTTRGTFAEIIAVRKGRNVIHLAQQNGTWATAPLFTATLCGRPITTADGWTEVQEAATCRACERWGAEIESARAAVIDVAHAEALAEDAARTDCGFSWSACDGCGSRLGGTRHRFAVFGWGDTDAPMLQCEGCERPGSNVRRVADLAADLCPFHEQQARDVMLQREDDDSWQFYDL